MPRLQAATAFLTRFNVTNLIVHMAAKCDVDANSNGAFMRYTTFGNEYDRLLNHWSVYVKWQ